MVADHNLFDYDKFVENIKNGAITCIPQPLYIYVNKSWHCGNVNFRLEIVRGYMKKRYLTDYPNYERLMYDISGIILNYYNTSSNGEGYYANIKWLINHYTMKLGWHRTSRYNLILPRQSPLKWQTKRHCRIKWLGYGNNSDDACIDINSINADNVDDIMVILKLGIKKKGHYFRRLENFSEHFFLTIPCILYNIDYNSNINNKNSNNNNNNQQKLNKKLLQVENSIKVKKSKLSESDSMKYGFDFEQRPLTAKLHIGPLPNYDLVPFTLSKFYITQHKNKNNGAPGIKKDVNIYNNNSNNTPIYLNVNDTIEMVIETTPRDMTYEVAENDIIVYDSDCYDFIKTKKYNIVVSFYKNESKKSILNQQFSIFYDAGVDVTKHCDIIPFFDWLNVRTNGYYDKTYCQYLPDMYPDTWHDPQQTPFEFEIYGFET